MKRILLSTVAGAVVAFAIDRLGGLSWRDSWAVSTLVGAMTAVGVWQALDARARRMSARSRKPLPWRPPLPTREEFLARCGPDPDAPRLTPNAPAQTQALEVAWYEAEAARLGVRRDPAEVARIRAARDAVSMPDPARLLRRQWLQDIREPTEAQVDAAHFAVDPHVAIDTDEIREIWRSMVDALMQGD